MVVNLVNGRCYLVSIVETMVDLMAYMSGRHWKIIRRTSFATLTKIELVLQERGLLDALLQWYSEPT